MGTLADLGIDEKEMTELTKRLFANKIWLSEHYEKIAETYVNKFVAIEDDQILDSDEDMDVLVKRLKKKNKNIDHLLIELINPKDAYLII